MFIQSQYIHIEIAKKSIFFLFMMKILQKMTVVTWVKFSLKQTAAVFEIYNISKKNIINSKISNLVLFIPY